MIGVLLFLILGAAPTGAQLVGVCYGMLGNNLPKPSEVVSLYKSNNIAKMRLYSPDQAALQALWNSDIQILLDVPGTELQALASNLSAATDWVRRNIVPYWPGVSFRYIAVGNELIPGDQAKYVLTAMRNVQSALSSAGLQNQIKVSTAVSTSVIGSSFPPSAGSFSSTVESYLPPIVEFLAINGAPLLVNLYPYFIYASNPNQISLPYALFSSSRVVVQDGQFSYDNLFDAVIDAFYGALEKVGGSNVTIVVSETGWPSAGGTAANISNAQTYNQNLIRHVGNGTPRRSGGIEAYIFGMFNENQQAQEIERSFGLFYPDKQPVYPINFGESDSTLLGNIRITVKFHFPYSLN